MISVASRDGEELKMTRDQGKSHEQNNLSYMFLTSGGLFPDMERGEELFSVMKKLFEINGKHSFLEKMENADYKLKSVYCLGKIYNIYAHNRDVERIKDISKNQKEIKDFLDQSKFSANSIKNLISHSAATTLDFYGHYDYSSNSDKELLKSCLELLTKMIDRAENNIQKPQKGIKSDKYGNEIIRIISGIVCKEILDEPLKHNFTTAEGRSIEGNIKEKQFIYFPMELIYVLIHAIDSNIRRANIKTALTK